MVFAYFDVINMKDIRFHQQLDFKIENIGYVSVERNENYFFEYKKG